MSAISTISHSAETLKCGACGSRIAGRWESLSPGLVRTLIKFYVAICTKQKNELHLQKELDLTKSEFTNFQKLRYFALVAKIKDKPGSWLLTWQGRDFIRNQKQVHKKVFIFDNKIQERSADLVSIGAVISSEEPYWLKRDDFLAAPPVTEMVQSDLF